MADNQKPLFVVRGGEQCFAPPTVQADTDFYGFVFPASRTALQALCDRHLNNPASGKVRYVPVVSRIIAGFANIHRGYSLTPPDSQFGWMPEIDVALWILVARIKHLGPLPIIERIGWYMPYLFVNTPAAVAMGREIWGFHKSLGTTQMPELDTDDALFAVDALAFPEPDPEVQIVTRRIFDVKRIDEKQLGGAAKSWTDSSGAFRDLMKSFVAGESELLLDLAKLLGLEDMPLVFLKQFRDVTHGTRACYQSIVEATANIIRFGGGGLLPGRYQLTIQPLASHPIVSDLGLAGPQLQASLAFHVNYDFVMNEGVEVWKA
jgi:hypothetical protein